MAARARGSESRSAAARRASVPQRSCVGCGRRAGKNELLRLTAVALSEHDAADGRRVAVIDRDGRRGGRGAYLCRDGERPRAECLQRAIRRGSVGRTLRASVSLDDKLVESVGR